MLVINQLLYYDTDHQVPKVDCPNADPGLDPKYIVMHFTGGSNAASAIKKLCDPRNDNPRSAVSAHLVISRTGEITQLVPFDQIAWHAGDSYWENRKYLNPVSIGIEMDNEGWFEKIEDQWISDSGIVRPVGDLHLGSHLKEDRELGWMPYPEIQWRAALEVAKALRIEYETIVDVLGHEDIHKEKVDPGPAFRMGDFRMALFERQDPLVEKYETIDHVTIYQDEEGNSPQLPARHPASPLPVDTNVKLVDKRKHPKTGQIWSLVLAKRTASGHKNIQGWIKFEHLKANRVASTAIVYIDNGSPPGHETPLHKARILPPKTPVRRLETKLDWTLIRTAEKFIKHSYIYAWLRSSAIRKQN